MKTSFTVFTEAHKETGGRVEKEVSLSLITAYEALQTLHQLQDEDSDESVMEFFRKEALPLCDAGWTKWDILSRWSLKYEGLL